MPDKKDFTANTSRNTCCTHYTQLTSYTYLRYIPEQKDFTVHTSQERLYILCTFG